MDPSSALLVCSAVFFWRQAVVAAEDPVKIAGIVIAYGNADIRH